MADARFGSFSPALFPRAAAAGFRRAWDAVRKRAALPDPGTGRLVSADAMAAFLNDALAIVEEEARKTAAERSPFAWLMYLRQVPPLFWAGEIATTAPYDATLAEAVSEMSGRRSPLRMSGGLTHYTPDADVNRQAGRLCGISTCMSQLHTWLRWAGKGAPFSVAGDMPEASPGPELRAAVEQYDQRVAQAPHHRLLRTGTGIEERPRGDDRLSLPVLARAMARRDTMPLFDVNFALEFVSLEHYARFNRTLAREGLKWWDDNAPALVAFLRMMLPLVLERTRSNSRQILGRAFVLMNDDEAHNVPAATLDDAAGVANEVFPGAAVPNDAREILRAVEAIPGSLRPPRLRAVRREGNVLCIDLFGAAQLLREAASLEPSGGTLARLRGHEFERSVQALIDSSPCAPPPELRKLAGFKIRADGSDFTDIDAVAVKDSKLLLITCKSREFSDAFDRGERRSLDAAAKLARNALAKFEALKRLLEPRPAVFEHAELGRFELVPVVCLPFIPYLELGHETGFALDGLRRVVSLDEFDAWLATEC